MNTFEAEVRSGRRYEFGRNWSSFLNKLTSERIEIAESSIIEMLRIGDLTGKTVLDIGSGSGLFSLAARRLGAEVHSFDYDPMSVNCTMKLRQLYAPGDQKWIIQEGSILDRNFLNSLGKFDIVYSWGALHHTGSMWSAFENAAGLVNDNGTLFIAIYNNHGRRSRAWRKVKEYYCSGLFGKVTASAIFIPYFFFRAILLCILSGTNVFSEYRKKRGMSITHDWFDWLGGFPYEFAKVEEIFHFFQTRGFTLDNIKTTNSLGNNQFVFVRDQGANGLDWRESV